QRGVDEPRVLRPRYPFEREDQHAVDFAGEEKAHEEGEHEGDQRLDQPLAQLDQMLQQRRLGRLDLLFVFFGPRAHAALSPSGLGAGGWGAGAGAGAASTKSFASSGAGISGIGRSRETVWLSGDGLSGDTGAVPSATGSDGAVPSGVAAAGTASAAGSAGGV